MPQPELAIFIYRNLPGVDEHNNKRQGELSLETCWPTKDGWFRLFTTYVGMSVTNQRNALDYFCGKENLSVKEMANAIASSLRKRVRSIPTPVQVFEVEGGGSLVRIVSGNDRSHKKPTRRQVAEG